MKVLLAASEVAPIIKFGGLGDVIGSLPKALQKLNINVDVIVPFYPSSKIEDLKVYKVLDFIVPFNNEANKTEVYKTKLPGSDVDVILLKNVKYFSTYGTKATTGQPSETEMFAFFNRAVVEFIKSQFNTYDIVHCHDWHTGLITHLLEDELSSSRPATIFTIHNLMYQGISSTDLLQEVGITPGSHALVDWDIVDGDLNMVQQGITSCDFITTVSPTYAKEILTEEFGAKFAEMLKAREGRLAGILNGIDYEAFPRDYDITNWMEHKAKEKAKLQETFDLNLDPNIPLFSFIGRLDPNQKGLDILFDALRTLSKKEIQFILLGTGDPVWEKKLIEMSKSVEEGNNMSINIKFDVELAESIYKGSDFLIVPSKYEPCGLIQMIAMWYGTVPVVHATGGLKDSVKEGQNGIIFSEYSSAELIKALDEAKKTYNGQNSDTYINMVEKCLVEDFGWDKSAKSYEEIYKKVLALRLEALQLKEDLFNGFN